MPEIDRPAHEQSNKEEEGVSRLNEDKDVEAEVVALANTVVYPGAMMVKSFDALLAVSTVEAAGCTDKLALRAHTRWIHRPQYCSEVHLGIFLKEAWITLPSYNP